MASEPDSSSYIASTTQESTRARGTTSAVWAYSRLDFDSLISGIDTVSIPESLGIDSYRYRIDSS